MAKILDLTGLKALAGYINKTYAKNIDVKTLQNTVGDSTKGLVKDVTSLKETQTKFNKFMDGATVDVDKAIDTLKEIQQYIVDDGQVSADFTTLKGVVGSSSAGLVKDVKDLQNSKADKSTLDGYLKTTDISSWAKATIKPTYTAAEVGAVTEKDLQDWAKLMTVTPVGGANKFVKLVKQENGKLIAEEESFESFTVEDIAAVFDELK